MLSAADPEGGLVEFTDNQTWFAILLVIHVFGAIVGIGPSFAFSVLGPMAGKEPPQGALSIIKGMDAIEKRLLIPVAYVTQPLTGALLIFNRSSIRSNFWKEEWLVAAIVLYIIITVLSVQNIKVTHEMIARMEGGTAGTPEFGALAKKAGMFGMTMTLLTVIIIILMIWKPLSECAGPLMRC